MAEVFGPTGYGAGGVGGGEVNMDKFRDGTDGGSGYAAMLEVGVAYAISYSNFLVNDNNANHKILRLRTDVNPMDYYDYSSWLTGTTNYVVSKLSINTPLDDIGNYCFRGYSISPLKFALSTTVNYVYHEIDRITGFKNDIAIKESKLDSAVYPNHPLKVLYSKSGKSSASFISCYRKKEFTTVGSRYEYIDTSNEDKYIYFLLQAGGGGGGGADSTWGLFNWASGGGGGGGGGAGILRLFVPRGSPRVVIQITVGGGGTRGSNGGSPTAGKKGGDTTIEFFNDGTNGLISVAKASYSGGGAGAKGIGNGSPGRSDRGKMIQFYNTLGNNFETLCTVNGGTGGGGDSDTDGSAVATSGNWTDVITADLFDVTFTASQTFGAGGTTGGQDRRGGGGGASWLGSGGRYG